LLQNCIKLICLLIEANYSKIVIVRESTIIGRLLKASSTQAAGKNWISIFNPKEKICPAI